MARRSHPSPGHKADQATWAAVRELIADSDGPTAYELHKPGQTVAVAYRQFNLKRLKPKTPVRVFIGHNHQDRLFVERNITGPLAKRGIEPWYSNADIIPGEKYARPIETGLLKSDWVIVIVSQHAAGFSSRILPVAIDDTKPSVLGDDLAQLHALDAHRSADLGEAIFRLPAAPAEQKKNGGEQNFYYRSRPPRHPDTTGLGNPERRAGSRPI